MGRRGRGEGGIERLPSGSWRGVVCKTDPATGGRVRQSKTFKMKADLLAWMASVRESGPAPDGTLGEWLDRWLELHKAEVSAGAYRTDEQVVTGRLKGARLPDDRPLAGVRLRDLSALHCRTFLASLSALSPSERHKVGRTLRMVCNAAAAAGLVPRSPMFKVKVPPPPKADTDSLTPDELVRVVAAADARGGCWPAFFRLAADAGLRPQEMAGLWVEDLNPAAGTVRVERAVCRTSNQIKRPKSDAGRRVVALSPPTLAALAGWVAARPSDRGPFLFPAKRGGHWRLRNLDRWVYQPVIRASGVEMTPYTLRHTMATLLLRAGISLKVVSVRLGHADVATTLRNYAHVLPGDQERAAAVMGDFLAPHALPTPPETTPAK